MALRVLLIATLALAAGCASVPKQSSEFDRIAEEMQSITVMPPDFTLTQMGAFSAEIASEMKLDIELELQATVEALVSENRYKLARLLVTDSVLASNPELREALFAQAQKVADARQDLAASASKSIDVAFGGDLDYFADLVHSDHFLFVQGSGWFSTAGAQVMAGFMAGLFGTSADVSGITLEGMLVDANLGKVLWYNSASTKNKDPRKPRDLLKCAQKLMSPLLGKSALKGDKSRDNVIIDKYRARLESAKDS